MPEFQLPDLGEGVTEGEVVEWRVREGDQVARDQVLMVVGTDKATVEIPSPLEGRVEAILAREGAVVRVGDPLLRISGGSPLPAAAEPTLAAPAAEPGPVLPPPPPPGERRSALPSVRRAARERGQDLAEVAGSGPGGRIRMEDLDTDQGEVRTPLRGARRVMAERMAEAHRRVPQVTLVLECDMGPVEDLVRGRAEAGPKGRPSILGLVCLAILAQLLEEPVFNASLDEARMEVVYHRLVQLGIAVQTAEGLKVATLRDADRRPPQQLLEELERLVAAARDGRLGATELGGATFTVSSGGRLGGLLATPIVNWPNLATLGVHAIEERPVVRNSQVVVGHCANLSLSFDHRVIDGMQASAFLYGIRGRLSEPDKLLR